MEKQLVSTTARIAKVSGIIYAYWANYCGMWQAMASNIPGVSVLNELGKDPWIKGTLTEDTLQGLRKYVAERRALLDSLWDADAGDGTTFADRYQWLNDVAFYDLIKNDMRSAVN